MNSSIERRLSLKLTFALSLLTTIVNVGNWLEKEFVVIFFYVRTHRGTWGSVFQSFTHCNNIHVLTLSQTRKTTKPLEFKLSHKFGTGLHEIQYGPAHYHFISSYNVKLTEYGIFLFICEISQTRCAYCTGFGRAVFSYFIIRWLCDQMVQLSLPSPQLLHVCIFLVKIRTFMQFSTSVSSHPESHNILKRRQWIFYEATISVEDIPPTDQCKMEFWRKTFYSCTRLPTCSFPWQYNLVRSLGNVKKQFHCADFMSANTTQSMGIQFSIQCHVKLNDATFYMDYRAMFAHHNCFRHFFKPFLCSNFSILYSLNNE